MAMHIFVGARCMRPALSDTPNQLHILLPIDLRRPRHIQLGDVVFGWVVGSRNHKIWKIGGPLQIPVSDFKYETKPSITLILVGLG